MQKSEYPVAGLSDLELEGIAAGMEKLGMNGGADAGAEEENGGDEEA